MSTAVSVGMFVFHTFLILKNLSTWEYIKWDKIEYLMNYKKKYSPFSYGWKSNIVDFFKSSWQDEPFDWVINEKDSQIK